MGITVLSVVSFVKLSSATVGCMPKTIRVIITVGIVHNSTPTYSTAYSQAHVRLLHPWGVVCQELGAHRTQSIATSSGEATRTPKGKKCLLLKVMTVRDWAAAMPATIASAMPGE